MTRARTTFAVILMTCVLSLSCADPIARRLLREEPPWDRDSPAETIEGPRVSAESPLPEISPDEGDAEAPPQSVSPSEVEQSSIPAGTYRGTTTIGAALIEDLGGEVVTNEIIVMVADDGNVTGLVVSEWTSGPSEPIEWEAEPGGPLHYCVSDMTITVKATLSRQLTDVIGVMEIERTQTLTIKHDDCPPGDDFAPETDHFTAEVLVAGDQMTGTVPDDFSFEATRY